MFLSALVTQFESDGSLIVDLADEGGPTVRIGPFGAGMPWERQEGERWVGTDHDFGVLLVNAAHESRRDLPVQRYLATVPVAVIDAARSMAYLQATVLQLCARWPEACDLLQSNPALLWLVADRYAADPSARHWVPLMLRRPQRQLLEFVMQQRVREAQVRCLRRLVLHAGDRATLTAVRRLVADERLVMRLKHWPRVPTGLLGLLFEAPVVAELHWLRDEIATTEDHFDVARLVEQRRRFVRDTVRMLGVIRRDGDGDAYDIRRYKSWRSLKALHDRLIAAAGRLGWGSLLDAELPAQQAFPAPPIRSDERFQAIITVAELIQEAERMHHCVVTRAVDIVAGRCALYRVQVGGERATLELTLGPDGAPLAIDEFRLACNAEPSDASWETARQWLADGQKRWTGRGDHVDVRCR